MYNILIPILLDNIKFIPNLDPTVLEQIEEAMNSTKQVFNKFTTEHARFEVYKDKGLSIEANENILISNNEKKTCILFDTVKLDSQIDF